MKKIHQYLLNLYFFLISVFIEMCVCVLGGGHGLLLGGHSVLFVIFLLI